VPGRRSLGQVVSTAFGDGAGEQPAGSGGGELGQDAEPARGLAEDGDAAGIAAEAGDVALDPAQRGLLVHQAVVARRAARLGGEGRVGQEAERAQPVVDGDDDHALAHQRRRVIVVALAGHQRPAVNPHHDGPGAEAVLGAGRREDVQVQAVLRGAGDAERRGRLRAVRRELGRVPYPVPAGGRLRRAPAQRADRRSRVGDAEELIRAAGGRAAKHAARGGDDRARTSGLLSGPGGAGGGGVSGSGARWRRQRKVGKWYENQLALPRSAS
jgi:hypothetical protein